MAKKKQMAQDSESPSREAEGGRTVEAVASKAEAVRRALAELGKRATPTEIQDFVYSRFGVEMTAKVISVYKSKLGGKSSRGNRRRKSAGETTVGETALKAAAFDGVRFKDLRTIKDIRDRLGPARMRELVELMAD
jgi:hypothetical protein